MKIDCCNHNCVKKHKCVRYTRAKHDGTYQGNQKQFSPENNTVKDFSCKNLSK